MCFEYVSHDHIVIIAFYIHDNPVTVGEGEHKQPYSKLYCFISLNSP